MTRGKSSYETCGWVDERIELFVDGDLDATATARLQAHIASCARCRQELDAARQVQHQLRELPVFDCPDETVDTALRRASTPSGAGLTGWIRGAMSGVSWRPALAGVLGVLIVISLAVTLRFQRALDRFSPEQIEQAETALRWTFAYVNEVGRKSGYAVRDEVIGAGVVEPMERAFRFAMPEDEHPTTNEQEEEDGSI